jgi:hypothetical protein
MNWWRFFRRDDADAEQHEELDFYVDITAQEYIDRGMEPGAAGQRRGGSSVTPPRSGRRFMV